MSLHLYTNCNLIKINLKYKSIRILLISSSIVAVAVICLSLLSSNTMHVQFIRLLQQSPSPWKGDVALASAAAQLQPSSNSNLPLVPSTSSSPSTSTSSSSSSSSSLPDVFQKVENSVVQITSTKSNPNEVVILNGVPQTGRRTALGSGFVYDNQGHVVTNYHVIDGARRADVTFTDGNTYSANVVGKDPNADIVVLQITGDYTQEKVVPLPLATSAVRPGEQVIAIGNPFGLSGTITTGIVSQKGRLLPNPDTGFSIPEMIQTDAAINPGNSGGPLLNTKGEVIGMNTAIFSRTGSYSGVGFAIPSNTIAKEVPLLIKNGSYSHPWLGISGGKISPDLIRAIGLPANYKGVVVASVQPDSPAEKAGLKGLTPRYNVNVNDDGSDDNSGSGTTPSQLGDIITAVDGHPVRQIDDIINYIDSQKNVGDNVKLTVNRNGKSMDLTSTLQARPSTVSQAQQQQQQQSPGLGPIPELPQIPGFPRLPPLLPPLLP
jgi:S1-C subfamily serine protease